MGPRGGGVGFILDILALRALRTLGKLSGEPAADTWSKGMRVSLTGEMPQGSPLWRKERMGEDPGTHPEAQGHPHQRTQEVGVQKRG